jgi:hypothetical protein
MLMKRPIKTFLFLLFPFVISAQEILTLENAVGTALEKASI